MRWSNYFLPTLKENPKDAEVVSHSLMLRSGMIKKAASGIYSILPLGWRSMKKLMNIVREELDRIGAVELIMPAIQPAELWMESGRWFKYGKELLRIKDRHERDFCFGPTHEEVITDILRDYIQSYKDLPVNLYQIQTKFRDEVRPRFGLIRQREFFMKDGYSFHSSEECLDRTYQDYYNAYRKIFERCRLEYTVVEADTGTIGGYQSHEFMVLAETGEDAIFFCPSCSYGANAEKAVSKLKEFIFDEKEKALEKVHTPQVHTVEEVSSFLGVPEEKIIKTMIYETEKAFYAVLIRGDRSINETKLKNFLDVQFLNLASEEKIERVTGGPMGFSGPLGLKGIEIFADHSIKNIKNAVVGANEKDYHYVNVNMGRDFNPSGWGDFQMVQRGDLCVNCNTPLQEYRGIEVGHIFKLGTKYSEPMKCLYIDEKGQKKPVIMGCYGLGIGRTLASAIEQSHDEKGIIWPLPLSPFSFIILSLNPEDKGVRELSDKIYQEMVQKGEEVFYDDREERAGVKFKDAELIGIPYQIIIGSKKAKENKVEIGIRKTGEKITMEVSEYYEKLKNIAL
ncbi:MAG: proline--tRNA ligase [Thermoanaerobaculia bacterium]